MLSSSEQLASIRQYCDDDDIKYIQNKNRGGSNNEKGSVYENNYAVFKIASLAKAFFESNLDAMLFSQILGFVDDLATEMLSSDGQKTVENIQLKNVETLSWGKATQSKTLANDFLKQKCLNDDRKLKTAAIQLVTSDESIAKKMRDNTPEEIAGFSQVIHFPADPYQSLEHIENLEGICPFSDIDKLEAVHANLLGAWAQNGKQGSISTLINIASNFNPTYVRPSGSREIPDAFAERLSDIADFNWHIEKGFFMWSFKNGLEKGCFSQHILSAKFDKFMTWVIDRRPETFEDIEGAL